VACVQRHVEDVAYMTLVFPTGVLAHSRMSWLDPCKTRRITVVGSRKMVVYDDLEIHEKLKVYDKHVDATREASTFGEYQFAYHYGSVVSPYVELQEPLRLECVHVAECVRARARPLTDGFNGTQVVDGIEDAFDTFEEALIDDAIENPSATTVSAMRRRTIELRRYLAPQRDVMAQLAQRDVMAQLAPMGDEWLDGDERLRLRYTADSIMRLVEDLDAARERGAVTHEELRERLSQQINRNMYLLSVVAAIFLPLSFLTGLLGINVGGIPGAEAGWAFLAVCIGLVVLLAAEIWFLRRRQWLD
jgi:hypothetical protein